MNNKNDVGAAHQLGQDPNVPTIKKDPYKGPEQVNANPIIPDNQADWLDQVLLAAYNHGHFDARWNESPNFERKAFYRAAITTKIAEAVSQAKFECEVTRLTDLARAAGHMEGCGHPDQYILMRYEAAKKNLKKLEGLKGDK